MVLLDNLYIINVIIGIKIVYTTSINISIKYLIIATLAIFNLNKQNSFTV